MLRCDCHSRFLKNLSSVRMQNTELQQTLNCNKKVLYVYRFKLHKLVLNDVLLDVIIDIRGAYRFVVIKQTFMIVCFYERITTHQIYV